MLHLLAIVRSARESFSGSLAWRVSFAMVLGATVGAAASLVPALVGTAIRGVMPHATAAPSRGFSGLVEGWLGTGPWWAGVVAALVGTLGAVALTLWSTRTGSQLAGDITAAIRIAMLRKAVHASPRALDEVGATLMAAQAPKAAPRPAASVRGTDMIKLSVTRDSAQVAEFVVAVMIGLPQAFVGLLTLGYDMVASGAWIALAGGGAFFVLSRLGAARAARRVSEEMRALQQVDASVFSHLGDTVGAIEDLRLLGAREQAVAEFSEAARACARAKARVAKAVAMSAQIRSTFTALSPLLIVVALHLMGGNIAPGDIAKLLLLVPLLMTRLDGLDGLRNGLLEREPMLAAARRVLELPQFPAPPQEPVRVEPSAAKGQLVFDGVCYTPPGAGRKVLDGFDLQVPAGSIVGLCGDTGCGKSTVLRLLLRLDDPDAGRILLDGTELRAIDPSVLPQVFGVLGQGSRLFERTLEHNLTLGLARKPSEQLLAEALRAVHLEELSGPQSADKRSLGTVFRAQPPNLSGGEQRRVLFARMLLREPRVFVLDEPEVGLPSSLAEELLKNMGELASGRTCMVVTHAPHLLGSSFNVVMQAGRVVGQGSHQELAGSCDAYQKLISKTLQAAAGQRENPLAAAQRL
jgi:ABC-type multidrug transport system fused ATPase/permease subunit